MMTVRILIKRNVRLFFHDFGMLFTSLITPLILLVLYATFLAGVYRDAFVGQLGGAPIEDALLEGLVGGQLLSSLLAVSCVTVSFCANLLMVQDRANGVRKDLLIAPVRRSVLAISYYAATLIVSFLISLLALSAGMVYLSLIGWYLSFSDVLLLILDVFLLVTFGTAISSIVNYFLTTQGQMSAVGSIVSSCYGFLCGAYMPISSFAKGLQRVISFLPGTYGTSLLRNHALRGPLSAMEEAGVPAAALDAIRDSVDCNIYFFGEKVAPYTMYLVLSGCMLLFLGVFILMNRLDKRKF